jgi:Dolichyl-phosphate-mannose-protein mannosyltransferase
MCDQATGDMNTYRDGSPRSILARLYFPVLLVLLLGGHGLLLVDCLRANFVTIDEAAHIPAGISHWETADYSLYRVNPPIPRMLAVLPVLPMAPTKAGLVPDRRPGARNEWPVAARFALDNTSCYLDLVRRARFAGIAWSLLGACLIFSWARELYGEFAGVLGMTIWCFGPNLLAYAPLVIPDVPATVAGLAATYAFWHYLRAPSWRRASIAGVLLGVAQLTKFTLVLLYLVWPLLWLLFRLPAGCRESGADGSPPGQDRAPPEKEDTRLLRLFAQGVLIALLSLFIINLGYEFQGTGCRLGDIPFISESFTGQRLDALQANNRFGSGWLGLVPTPLPEDYLRGIDVQRQAFERSWETKPSYLAGLWREKGWWYYYLYALAVKVPLGFWALILWGLVLTLSSHPASAGWRDELALWLPAVAVLALVSSQTGFNRHLRYVLPAFPFVIISTSKVACFLRRSHWPVGILACGLLAWGTASSLSVRPHYLSYFNELAGGPAHGHDHLLSSNIDWGQDLLFLKQWLSEHAEARPIGLAYFNLIDARVAGIDYVFPPLGPVAALPSDPAALLQLGPQPGYFAVSVEYVRGSNNVMPCDGKGGTVSLPPHALEYFREFKPIAKAGYSIFIYHITLEQANRVRRKYGLPTLSAPVQRPEAPGFPARRSTGSVLLPRHLEDNRGLRQTPARGSKIAQ